MKDTDFEKLLRFKVINEVAYPVSNKAQEFCYSNENEDVYLLPQTARDKAFHKCYFLFCNWIWEQLPTKFKLERCPKQADMYKYLKLIQGDYKVSMSYKDLEVIEFKSISFGKMSNDQFKDYVNEQIAALYTNILVPLKLEHLHDKAEQEFKGLFSKLI